MKACPRTACSSTATVATTLTDMIGTNAMPMRQGYCHAKYQETVDFSDLERLLCLCSTPELLEQPGAGACPCGLLVGTYRNTTPTGGSTPHTAP